MLDNIRYQLSHANKHLLLLSIFGVITGVLAGLVIIALRLSIEVMQQQLLPDGSIEGYESLPFWARFLLPVAGALLLGWLFQALSANTRAIGVVHTIERLDYHQGHFPLRNALAQFVGAAVSLISGHSVGREGPSIHLGAASGSLLGLWLHLPNNAIRTLVACGIAAGIAASFNTPLAGVIFVVEVILLEYTLASLIPIILAAVTATLLSRAVFGDASVFIVPEIDLVTHGHFPWIILMGLLIGLFASVYIRLLLRFSNTAIDQPIWKRMTLGGIIVGVCALFVPEIMSMGYDTVESAILGQYTFLALVIIVVIKLLATTAGLGLGLPGGLIGPCIFLGATLGAALGQVFGLFTTEETVHISLFAIIGMGAMMGATLQAPLAALIAIFELTLSAHIIFPALLAIAVANLTCNEILKQPSIFRSLLRIRGLDYKNNPIAQALRRIGVASTMNKEFIVLPKVANRKIVSDSLKKNPKWVLIDSDHAIRTLLPAIDIQRYLRESQQPEIQLDEIPALRIDAAGILSQASMQDAFETIEQTSAEAVYIQSSSKPVKILGIITREDIESQQKINI